MPNDIIASQTIKFWGRAVKLVLLGACKIRPQLILSVLLCAHITNACADDTPKMPYASCRPELLGAPFDINQCVTFFNSKLASFSPDQIQTYEAYFATIKNIQFPTVELAYLFNEYPSPQVLFELQEAGFSVAKHVYSNQILSYDDPGNKLFLIEYEQTRTLYSLVIAMLENKANLTEQEKQIIQISQQRNACIGQWLDNVKNNEARKVNNREIIDNCFTAYKSQ